MAVLPQRSCTVRCAVEREKVGDATSRDDSRSLRSAEGAPGQIHSVYPSSDSSAHRLRLGVVYLGPDELAILITYRSADEAAARCTTLCNNIVVTSDTNVIACFYSRVKSKVYAIIKTVGLKRPRIHAV